LFVFLFLCGSLVEVKLGLGFGCWWWFCSVGGTLPGRFWVSHYEGEKT